MNENRGAATRLRLPLLDRLLEPDQETSPGQLPSEASAVKTLRDAVRRDLEALLNARRRRLPPPPNLIELPVSPIGYGVPDPTAGSFTDEARRSMLAREIEATIRRFEPRLAAVSVHVRQEEREAADGVLRLRIEAVLRTDPVPEQIVFDTEVRPTTLDVAVRRG